MAALNTSDKNEANTSVSLSSLRRAAQLGTLPIQYLETMQSQYEQDPESLSPEWSGFFLGMELAENGTLPFSTQQEKDSKNAPPSRDQIVASLARRLVTLHRLIGHTAAKIDPLGLQKRKLPVELDPESYGLQGTDLDAPMVIKAIDADHAWPFEEILSILRRVYCGSIGSEYFHITSTEQREWIKRRLESSQGDWSHSQSRQDKLEVMQGLIAAEGFERYLHKRYIGQKRFSLEGGESLIPLLKRVIKSGSKRGINSMVLGMAHRGRLNVLVNILGKSTGELFSEFDGSVDLEALSGSGDVKYHQGFYSKVRTAEGQMKLALAFNPSHLEIVSPVVEGGVKARQDHYDHHKADDPNDKGTDHVLPVTIHGDAAFIGQGVTAETLNLSKTSGYGTGGTLHIVINNQIGFTTSLPQDARSTDYCTDVAKMVQAPIFHVNADDPDAVMFITKLALDYRMTFNSDVVIDLVCYRRHGHNEADEPMMTQPKMYACIKDHPTTRAQYAAKLIEADVAQPQDIQQMEQRYRQALDNGEVVFTECLEGSHSGYQQKWQRYLQATSAQEQTDTRFDQDTLIALGERALQVPPILSLHQRVEKVLQERRRMLQGDIALDWGMAETLAYASLLHDGYAVRLSGQDSGRGTFAHRHAVLHDQHRGSSHTPLAHLSPQQPSFTVINSLLSEMAVLGFEYGYATASPNSLVIWEAQFGDFANGAQVVIDQFISSGYLKWGRLCQLTLFLPHGYEGQGPEHSSARLERFLQLCAELNMRVWVPTTPAQLFHLLRDQMMRDFRRPLVVMTPKSLLRHPLAKSHLSELSDGKLQPVLAETETLDHQQIRRIVLCSGKVYYDVLKNRSERKIDNIALIRVEQLYPFPRSHLQTLIQSYPQATEVVWCQEEPRNQGAWYQIQHHLRALLNTQQSLAYAGRPASASPACGYAKLHLAEQQQLIDSALSPNTIDDEGERLQDDY